ncbi:MAG: carboxymuconolactone decarboxylase family protein [Dehalococcoidia bacterium]|jgi:alkylhydroperoxidase family enzyme|nr:carboxymuconolactone decarboxylase family protein [Dehalococcoidia bacterium]
MARLPYLNQEDLAEDDRRLLERPANLFRQLVHQPDGFRSYSRLGLWIRNQNDLDPRLRELAIIQIGYMTDCAYEYTHHIKLGLEQFGLSEDDVRAVAIESRGDASGLGDVERAVLRLTRQVTDTLAPTDAAFEEVREQLGDATLVALLMAVSFYAMTVRLLFSLQVDLEPEYAHYLEEFPLGG